VGIDPEAEVGMLIKFSFQLVSKPQGSSASTSKRCSVL
jgi:hypothetical protein